MKRPHLDADTLITAPAPASFSSVDLTFVPGPVVLLGAPGVGKGTQARLLMSAFGIPQISTGDILRANIAQGTALGLRARSLMDGGQLVDDATVNSMVADRLDHATYKDVVHGFILDGYPRTAAQSAFIEELLADPAVQHGAGAQACLPLIAIDINVEEPVLLQRITGRRTCAACSHIYNIYSNPPRLPGVCDLDGSPLQQRSDDTDEAFQERMREYRAKTAEVIRYFGAKSERFRAVNGDQPVEQVNAEIVAALHDLRRQSAATTS